MGMSERSSAERREIRLSTKELEQISKHWRLRGEDVRYILTRSGYTVQEYRNHLLVNHAPISTVRSVYRLMRRGEIPTRYADLLEQLVGSVHFQTLVMEIIEREHIGEIRSTSRESDR